MPVLLESLICFLPDFRGFTFQNLEYCKFSPLTSENPRLADDIKLITDMAVMKEEGGGGKINLSKKEITIANTICSLSVSLHPLLLCLYSVEFNVPTSTQVDENEILAVMLVTRHLCTY
jgi:hypothetical protein